MAKAEKTLGVVLTLTEEEAMALRSLLVNEQWPDRGDIADCLNHIWSSLTKIFPDDTE